MRLAALPYVPGDVAGDLARNVAQACLVEPELDVLVFRSPSLHDQVCDQGGAVLDGNVENKIRLAAERAIDHRARHFGLECRDAHYCALAMARAALRVA